MLIMIVVILLGFSHLAYEMCETPERKIRVQPKPCDDGHMIQTIIEHLLHLDKYLIHFVQLFGGWAYLGLFLVIFLEMGCILTPFLPGDSLLFATGALAATGVLRFSWLVVLLFMACFLGIVTNYWVGRWLGKVLMSQHSRARRWVNPKHVSKAHAFFERYGGKTLIIACFLPIIRTFVPFVAGMVEMTAKRLLVNACIGSLLWVVGILVLSYWFGNIPYIKHHFSVFVLGIILLSLVFPVIELFRSWLQSRRFKR